MKAIDRVKKRAYIKYYGDAKNSEMAEADMCVVCYGDTVQDFLVLTVVYVRGNNVVEKTAVLNMLSITCLVIDTPHMSHSP